MENTHINEKEIPVVLLIFTVNARRLNPKVKQIFHFWFFILLQVYIVINSHWELSLPNAPGKDKLWEEASPEEKRSNS